MVDEKGMKKEETDADAGLASRDVQSVRIYEVGYHIAPTAKEEDIEKIVATVRSLIEKAGGSFIAEGAPSLMKLAYPMGAREGGKNVEYDRGYFGWIKFEAVIAAAQALESSLKQSPDFFRFIVFRTVREDTRAKMKAPTLREVKRTDIIRQVPRRVEESSIPVSEEDLEKAIQDITAE
jgi:ribosomal protein S6